MKRAWGGRWGQSSTWVRKGAATAAAAAAAGGSSTQGGEAAAGGVASQQQAQPPAPAKWGNSAANAYMLMYRRVDPAENRRHLRRDEVPEHVGKQVREQDRRAAEVEAAAEAARAALASSVKVRVLLNGGPDDRMVLGDKRRPLRELVDRAAETFGLPIEGALPIERDLPIEEGVPIEGRGVPNALPETATRGEGREGLARGEEKLLPLSAPSTSPDIPAMGAAATAAVAAVPAREDGGEMGPSPSSGSGDWGAKDALSDGGDSCGGETDRETQDEGRSDECVGGCGREGGGGASDGGGGGGGGGGGSGGREIGRRGEHGVAAKEKEQTRSCSAGLSRDGERASGVGIIASASSSSKVASPSLPPPLPARLVRLREFLQAPQLPGAALDEALTPGDLSFFNGKTVWLETRKPGEVWPHFDRDEVNVAVIRFNRALGPAAAETAAVAAAAGGGPSSGAKKGIDGVTGGGGNVEDGASGKPVAPPPPPPPPLPPALYPILGKFAPERKTRMKASGSVRELRAAFAAFAGTKEARTRVFTMRAENAQATYKVLCPLPPRSGGSRRCDSPRSGHVSEISGRVGSGDGGGGSGSGTGSEIVSVAAADNGASTPCQPQEGKAKEDDEAEAIEREMPALPPRASYGKRCPRRRTRCPSPPKFVPASASASAVSDGAGAGVAVAVGRPPWESKVSTVSFRTAKEVAASEAAAAEPAPAAAAGAVGEGVGAGAGAVVLGEAASTAALLRVDGEGSSLSASLSAAAAAVTAADGGRGGEAVANAAGCPRSASSLSSLSSTKSADATEEAQQAGGEGSCGNGGGSGGSGGGGDGRGGEGGGRGDVDGAFHNGGGDEDEDGDIDNDSDEESAVVVLGERGSNSVLKIYVEEVPEDEEEGEPSLAVQVAEDQPNRWAGAIGAR